MDTVSLVTLVILFICLMPIAAGKKKLIPFIIALLITFFCIRYIVTLNYKNTALQVTSIISMLIIVIVFGSLPIEESWLITLFYLTMVYGIFSYYELF
jgi:hypothetical protein